MREVPLHGPTLFRDNPHAGSVGDRGLVSWYLLHPTPSPRPEP